jgi:hypothetical protein
MGIAMKVLREQLDNAQQQRILREATHPISWIPPQNGGGFFRKSRRHSC